MRQVKKALKEQQKQQKHQYARPPPGRPVYLCNITEIRATFLYIAKATSYIHQ